MMGENLVIVESPTKAGTIQKFLGKGFQVKSSFGHIRDLQEKSLSVDVEHGFTPEYVIPAGKKKVVSELKAAAAKADKVWLASDEDREGEAISWHLCEALGLDPATTGRIVFHEITKPAIQHALENPRTVDMNLVNAQQARRVLDRLVGFELSPILWRKIQRGLSAGRVQSVALRLVVDREREILAFKSEPYYHVEGEFFADKTRLKGTLESRFEDAAEARRFLEDSFGAKYTVGRIERKQGVRYPAAPFTTSTLQQEASRKLHMSVSRTMSLAQSLYERGLITYMRTDSTNLSALAINSAKTFITDNFGPEYSHPRQFKTHSKGAQEAHEAIRPTYISNTSIEGSPQEQKLYNLIWMRTVASQMADASVMNTRVLLDSDRRSEKFAIQATEVLFDGFLKLYMEGADDESDDDASEALLPELHEGDVLAAGEISALCRFTVPPFRYSEATLVKKLEELGIGRPSTYSPTITTLTTGRGYIVKGDKEGTRYDVTNYVLRDGSVTEKHKTETVGAERGKLLPQEIGIIVTDYLEGAFPDIMDYDFTAKVEKDFDAVADGELEWRDVIASFYSSFHPKVNTSMHDGQYTKVSRELGIDPTDGKKIVAKFGQYGPYVQKGDGPGRQFASLAKGQLIENITLEDAIKLFRLPRKVGEYNGVEIIAARGRFGPYIKYGSSNITLPRGKDPLTVSLEECIELIGAEGGKAQASQPIAEFGGISVMNGRYGPYIKFAGANYRIPKGTDAASLTEADCRKIIEGGAPTSGGRRYVRYTKK